MPTDPNQPTTPSPQEQEGKVLTAEKIEAAVADAAEANFRYGISRGDERRNIAHAADEKVLAMLHAGLAAQEANEGLRRERDVANQRTESFKHELENRLFPDAPRIHSVVFDASTGLVNAKFDVTEVGSRRDLRIVVHSDELVEARAALARQAPPTEGALRAAAQAFVDRVELSRCVSEIPGSCYLEYRTLRDAIAAKEPAGEAPQKPSPERDLEAEQWRSDIESELLNSRIAFARPGEDKRLPEAVYGLIGRAVGIMERRFKPTESSDARERGLRMLRELRDYFRELSASYKRDGKPREILCIAQHAESMVQATIDDEEKKLAEAPREDAKAGALVEEVDVHDTPGWTKNLGVRLTIVGNYADPRLGSVSRDMQALRDAVMELAKALEARR